MGTSASGLAKVYTADGGSGSAGGGDDGAAPAIVGACRSGCRKLRTSARRRLPARESVIVRTHAGGLQHVKLTGWSRQLRATAYLP
jgi:hypothetical protein